MSGLPTCVQIHEEGPSEGFQIEPAPISTADKIKLIEALAQTGLRHSNRRELSPELPCRALRHH